MAPSTLGLCGGMDTLEPYLVCELGDPYRFVVFFVACSTNTPGFRTVEMERDGVNLLLQRSNTILLGQ